MYCLFTDNKLYGKIFPNYFVFPFLFYAKKKKEKSKTTIITNVCVPNKQIVSEIIFSFVVGLNTNSINNTLIYFITTTNVNSDQRSTTTIDFGPHSFETFSISKGKQTIRNTRA